MRKRITTRWYMGAWMIWVIALAASVTFARGALPANVVLAVAGLVASVMWIGALVKLAQQRAWGWFGAVLLLELFLLGIVGMVAYAIAGPDDAEQVVIRPTTT